jgi:predicted phosphodiesterase
MTVAALYDIHGNAHALAAVLAELPDEAAVVIGGDIALGPQPVETLELLESLGDRAHWIRGNCERPDPHTDELWEQRRVWTEQRLDAGRRRFLEGLPETLSLEIDGLGRTLFCHGSPRSDEEMITALSSEERLREILAAVDERVVVCGHTHHQFDRAVAGMRIVNAGSVGMAYEGRPGSHWAVLGPGVELRRTEYDFAAAEAAIRASGYPDSEEAIEVLFTSPPSAAEVADHFERQAVEKAAS